MVAARRATRRRLIDSGRNGAQGPITSVLAIASGPEQRLDRLPEDLRVAVHVRSSGGGGHEPMFGRVD